MEIVVCRCQTAREKRRIRSILNTGGNGNTGGNCSTVKQEYEKNHRDDDVRVPLFFYDVRRYDTIILRLKI